MSAPKDTCFLPKLAQAVATVTVSVTATVTPARDYARESADAAWFAAAGTGWCHWRLNWRYGHDILLPCRASSTTTRKGTSS
ncbi:unnamed protein product [Clonostachys rosea f. rosea IK726]|uniref:Uncharacterized protein n=1 Tax=Clonostachys rosea f. rosea IK726 TaxID=1349383 RepID=A0ACA9UIX6_BIOOC|nr:unnamed protein product [Clonostachys rosea f. rosea IK726]